MPAAGRKPSLSAVRSGKVAACCEPKHLAKEPEEVGVLDPPRAAATCTFARAALEGLQLQVHIELGALPKQWKPPNLDQVRKKAVKKPTCLVGPMEMDTLQFRCKIWRS